MIHEEEEKGWSFKTRDCNQTTKENVETCEYMAKQQSEVIVFWKIIPLIFVTFSFNKLISPLGFLQTFLLYMKALL